MKRFYLPAGFLRFWKRPLVLSVVGLSMMAVIFYAVERFRERGAWNDYAAEARARNIPLEPADFPFTAVPDAQNFAAIPYFQETAPGGLAGPAFMSLLSDDKVLNARMKGASAPVETLDFWVDAKTGAVSSPIVGASAAKTILAQLDAETGNLWRQFQDAFDRPRGQFAGSFAERARSAGNRPGRPYLRIHLAGQLAAERLYLHCADGDGAAAFEDVQIALRVADTLKGDPGLISAMIRVAEIPRLANGIWAGLSREIWDEPTLVQIEALLASLDLLESLRLGLESERAKQNAECEQFLRGDFTSFANYSDSKPSPNWRFYPAAWIYRTQRLNNRYYDELLAGFDMGRHTVTIRADLAKQLDQTRNPVQRWREMLWMRMSPDVSRSQCRTVFVESVVRQAGTACALERYRHAHGSYPEELSALVATGFIPFLPLDPVSNAPMEYQRMADGRYSLQSTEADRVSRNMVASDWPHAWIPGPKAAAKSRSASAPSPRLCLPSKVNPIQAVWPRPT